MLLRDIFIQLGEFWTLDFPISYKKPFFSTVVDQDCLSDISHRYGYVLPVKGKHLKFWSIRLNILSSDDSYFNTLDTKHKFINKRLIETVSNTFMCFHYADYEHFLTLSYRDRQYYLIDIVQDELKRISEEFEAPWLTEIKPYLGRIETKYFAIESIE